VKTGIQRKKGAQQHKHMNQKVGIKKVPNNNKTVPQQIATALPRND